MQITNPVHRAGLEANLTSAAVQALPAGENPGQRTYEMRAALDAYFAQYPAAVGNITATTPPTFRLTPARVAEERAGRRASA
jgi:hypothetical protein